ncbi:hypothetical protein SAMD00019534_125000 [Acytostelium subglobosum LB1]|uniref:hypothetical protein n=1 Tax=Acytostelium subglobosum LB1 TaxID=1410327 RepID=UPI000644AFC8|nr:hypothetical protein SAMD00019534_125000 [Acytostelium subglobosum LB1]GAM29324.1 hypothetical protein SAMD00019534_125000 [Acytostelium subglobosum LB1]|eukprot:XP_012747751.1 hypothetical protein SAMD00019534_125000 [Acytostelium subglobosum LB1]
MDTVYQNIIRQAENINNKDVTVEENGVSYNVYINNAVPKVISRELKVKLVNHLTSNGYVIDVRSAGNKTFLSRPKMDVTTNSHLLGSKKATF